MEHTSTPTPTDLSSRNIGRQMGVMLAVVSVLIVAFMAMHPVSHSHSMAEFAAETSRGIPRNAMVHGVLVALVPLLFAGQVALAMTMRVRGAVVILALTAGGVGVVSGMAAGLTNGFIVPQTAGAFDGASAQTMDALGVAMRLCRSVNQTSAQVHVIAMCAAMIGFGVAFLSQRPRGKVMGALSLLCGAGPLAALAHGYLPMTVPGFGTFVAIQAIWGVGAGVWMYRRSG